MASGGKQAEGNADNRGGGVALESRAAIGQRPGPTLRRDVIRGTLPAQISKRLPESLAPVAVAARRAVP